MVKKKAKSKNKPTGKNSENSNLKIIAWVITALIAICGGVPGVIQIIDYFSIPQINVISITPVLVYDEVTYNNPWNATFTYDDFYFVIEVSALKNPVYISKLKLSPNKSKRNCIKEIILIYLLVVIIIELANQAVIMYVFAVNEHKEQEILS